MAERADPRDDPSDRLAGRTGAPAGRLVGDPPDPRPACPLRPVPCPAGRRPHPGRGGPRGGRAERHGQDDPVQRDHGAPPGAAGLDPLRGARHHRARPLPGRGAGHRLHPPGAPALAGPHRGRAPAPRGARGRLVDRGSGVRRVPAARRTAAERRRPALGRRAADARHLARPPPGPAAAGARRADRGARPPHRRPARGAALVARGRGRRRHPPHRTEHRGRDGHRRRRRDHGQRPDQPGHPGRRAGRRPRPPAAPSRGRAGFRRRRRYRTRGASRSCRNEGERRSASRAPWNPPPRAARTETCRTAGAAARGEPTPADGDDAAPMPPAARSRLAYVPPTRWSRAAWDADRGPGASAGQGTDAVPAPEAIHSAARGASEPLPPSSDGRTRPPSLPPAAARAALPGARRAAPRSRRRQRGARRRHLRHQGRRAWLYPRPPRGIRAQPPHRRPLDLGTALLRRRPPAPRGRPPPARRERGLHRRPRRLGRGDGRSLRALDGAPGR